MKIVVPAVMARSLLPRVSQFEDDSFTFGGGANSCASWIRDRERTSSYLANIQWVLGYVSAAGNCVELEKTDVNAMALFMDKYCREHPRSRISDAAFELVCSLMK
jgi:hypothetical protein